jgi:hypothetical protein
MDLHGTDKGEVEHRLVWVMEQRFGAEPRCVPDAGGIERVKRHLVGEWKDCEYHSMFISRDVGLQYRCPCPVGASGGGYRGIVAEQGLC